MSQLFAPDEQSIGVSASVLPMNILGLFSLELTSWISLQTKGLSRVFISTTIPKHKFFGQCLGLPHGPAILQGWFWAHTPIAACLATPLHLGLSPQAQPLLL